MERAGRRGFRHVPGEPWKRQGPRLVQAQGMGLLCPSLREGPPSGASGFLATDQPLERDSGIFIAPHLAAFHSAALSHWLQFPLTPNQIWVHRRPRCIYLRLTTRSSCCCCRERDIGPDIWAVGNLRKEGAGAPSLLSPRWLPQNNTPARPSNGNHLPQPSVADPNLRRREPKRKINM